MMNTKPISVHCSISDLPYPIISDIISLLPTKSILSCKLVSKLWCSLINHPKFSKSSTSITMIACCAASLHLIEPEVDYTIEQINGKSCLQLGEKSVIKYSEDWIGSFDIVNSCQGLVCLTTTGFSMDRDGVYFVVCNPVMSDYVVVKHPLASKNKKNYRHMGWPVHTGFRFSWDSNQYKVLWIFYDKTQNDDDNGFCVHADNVCTLGGADEWRRLKNRPPQGYKWHGDAIFLKGVLHFAISHKSIGSAAIAAFDCEEEIFTLMNLPDICRRDIESLKTPGLTILHSQLCFSIATIAENYRTAIWVMKEYGVKASWTKLFVFSARELYGRFFPISYKPLTYWRNGEVLMLRDACLVSFDLASNTCRTVTNTRFTGHANAMLFDPIFLQTKNIITQGKQGTTKAIE